MGQRLCLRLETALDIVGKHSEWERWIKNWPLFTVAIEPEIADSRIIMTTPVRHCLEIESSLFLSCSLSPVVVVAWFWKFNAVQYIQLITKVPLKTSSLLKPNYLFILNSVAYRVALSTILTIIRVHDATSTETHIKRVNSWELKLFDELLKSVTHTVSLNGHWNSRQFSKVATSLASSCLPRREVVKQKTEAHRRVKRIKGGRRVGCVVTLSLHDISVAVSHPLSSTNQPTNQSTPTPSLCRLCYYASRFCILNTSHNIYSQTGGTAVDGG